MPSESLHDTPPPPDEDTSAENAGGACEPDAALPTELSEFSQRLASFGLGEAPDPLLTESSPPTPRRPRR
jgi:hypothetical protein